jgi:hypothetical protein
MLARLCKLTRLFVALVERRTRLALGGNHDDEEANGLADAVALVAVISMCSLGWRLQPPRGAQRKKHRICRFLKVASPG